MKNLIKLLLLPKKLEELSVLLGKLGNYGRLELIHSDGKGGWDAQMILPFAVGDKMKEKIIEINPQQPYDFFEAIDELLKEAKKYQLRK